MINGMRAAALAAGLGMTTYGCGVFEQDSTTQCHPVEIDDKAYAYAHKTQDFGFITNVTGIKDWNDLLLGSAMCKQAVSYMDIEAGKKVRVIGVANTHNGGAVALNNLCIVIGLPDTATPKPQPSTEVAVACPVMR